MIAGDLPPYDPKNLQSLLGYARPVHRRSSGICQLCRFGDGADPQLLSWLQLTVEHLIAQSQGGYPKEIRAAVVQRWPDWSPVDQDDLSERIHVANMVTACQFCNATTSRDQSAKSMGEVISAATGGDADTALASIEAELGAYSQEEAPCGGPQAGLH